MHNAISLFNHLLEHFPGVKEHSSFSRSQGVQVLFFSRYFLVEFADSMARE